MTDLPTDTVLDAIADRRAERRNFLRYAGGAAASAGGLALLAACGGDNDDGNATPSPTPTASSSASAVDANVLNFALNLEYLEAQFYSWAAFGQALPAALTTGVGATGTVTGGAAVPFSDPIVAQYAREIAVDEVQHVAFLRNVLGGSAVAMPAINIAGDATGAFTAAARAAGVVGATGVFNPYADDVSFLLGAYLFEDVGVSAYKGASPLITNNTYLDAAAGILAVEAFHAGLIRNALYAKGIGASTLRTASESISNARDTLDGPADLDQGVATQTVPYVNTGGTTVNVQVSNIAPTDANGIAFSRTPAQVRNIVYLTAGTSASSGGFFPNGVNGTLRTTAA